MKLESYKEKIAFFIVLLNDACDRLGSGSFQEREKSRYILAAKKYTNSFFLATILVVNSF